MNTQLLSFIGKNFMKKIAPLFIATAATHTLAHDGHGMGGSHWHSTDVWGFAFVAGLALAAWFIGRGK